MSSFDRFPPEVQRLPRVGALLDPDVERILSLRPDLVIAYASQADLVASWSARASLSTSTATARWRTSLPGCAISARRIGMAAEAGRAAADVERGLAEVRASVAGGAGPRTVLVIGREPQSLRAISVSGGYGFLHDLLDLAGGSNVFGDVKRESMMVTTETILRGAAGRHYRAALFGHARRVTTRRASGHAWRLLPGVPAVRNGRVHLLYGGELVVPGPRVVLTARAFARALHGG